MVLSRLYSASAPLSSLISSQRCELILQEGADVSQMRHMDTCTLAHGGRGLFHFICSLIAGFIAKEEHFNISQTLAPLSLVMGLFAKLSNLG